MPADRTDPTGRPLRVSDLLGRRILDAEGNYLGRVVDVVTELDEQGRPELTAAVVVRGPWGRLLGYDRDQVRGPWLLESLARRILRRTMTRVAWSDLVWQESPPSGRD